MKMCASSFQSHSNLLPLAGLTGSLCSALSTGQAVQQQWLKTVSPFQEPPPGPISKPPSSTSAVDTPAKPVWWHARCLRDTEHFSFSTGYSSNKKCPRQEHSGFLIFHVGEHIKKLNPCRNICLIKKTSGLEKKRSGLRHLVERVSPLATSLRLTAGESWHSGEKGCTHTGLRTYALSCPLAIIAESHNIRS